MGKGPFFHNFFIHNLMPSESIFLKIALLILLFFFFLFTVVVFNQARVMNRLVKTPASFVLIVVALLPLLGALSLFLIALGIL